MCNSANNAICLLIFHPTTFVLSVYKLILEEWVWLGYALCNCMHWLRWNSESLAHHAYLYVGYLEVSLDRTVGVEPDDNAWHGWWVHLPFKVYLADCNEQQLLERCIFMTMDLLLYWNALPTGWIFIKSIQTLPFPKIIFPFGSPLVMFKVSPVPGGESTMKYTDCDRLYILIMYSHV